MAGHKMSGLDLIGTSSASIIKLAMTPRCTSSSLITRQSRSVRDTQPDRLHDAFHSRSSKPDSDLYQRDNKWLFNFERELYGDGSCADLWRGRYAECAGKHKRLNCASGTPTRSPALKCIVLYATLPVGSTGFRIQTRLPEERMQQVRRTALQPSTPKNGGTSSSRISSIPLATV